MATVADGLDGPIDVNELLHLICLAAIDNVRGADYAGITLADRHGKLETPAATHPLVHQVDALQYQYREGPCVDAVRGRWQARSDDLRVDIRWPEYGPLAADLGIVSQLGIELFDNRASSPASICTHRSPAPSTTTPSKRPCCSPFRPPTPWAG